MSRRFNPRIPLMRYPSVIKAPVERDYTGVAGYFVSAIREMAVSENSPLSKTALLHAAQCQKRLALEALHPEERDPLELPDRMRMRLGQLVGLEARKRYPGGSVGRVPDSYAASIQRTQDLIAGGAKVIYEAAFEAQGVRVVADILVRRQAGWRLIEVKSTSEPKPEHLLDVAIQIHTLRQSGLQPESAALLHLNKEYVRRGALDYEALFAETLLSAEVDELQREVERIIGISRATLESGSVPDIPIGPYCHDPVDCDFIGHCWQDVPSPSVFDVYYIGGKAYDLYAQGVERIEDIPRGYPLDRRSSFHVAAHKTGEVIVKGEELRHFLAELDYPLYYMDFETFAFPIPPFDGLRPYEKVPFQYSLHVQRAPGGRLEHSGYLAQAGDDPRRHFIAQLLEETAGAGSIVVYFAPFERGVLESLARWFPEYRVAIEGQLEKFIDLIVPFRQRLYWHPGMGGSNSLKRVLPIFAPDLSYEDLEIGDGEEAMAVFLSLEEEGDPDRVAALRQSLWKYCALDTLAMVRIVDGLRKAAGP
jgi:hypothetical protein